LAGTGGGEVVEVEELIFEIRDTSNGLSALYKFRGGGIGLGASPVTVSGGGPASRITTSPHSVRVTRFGPMAAIGGGPSPPPVIVSKALFIMSFRPDDGSGLSRTPIFSIDTGPITIPGGDLHGGHFSILSVCKGQPGASKNILILPVE
jgi:hypothetical protein